MTANSGLLQKFILHLGNFWWSFEEVPAPSLGVIGPESSSIMGALDIASMLLFHDLLSEKQLLGFGYKLFRVGRSS